MKRPTQRTAIALLLLVAAACTLPLLAWSKSPLLRGKPAAHGNRIVTLAPHLAELVCAVGACRDLVAVSAFTDYPASVERLEVIGDTTHLSYERLLGLHASHIFAWAGGTPDWQLAKLRQLGLPVTALQISSLDEVGNTLTQLGSRLGHASEGAAAAARFNSRIAALRARHAPARKLRVFYQIETSPPYTVNRTSPISEVITLCGGSNIFADLPTLSAAVSAEAILAERPDVVLHSDGDGRAIRDFWGRFPDTPVTQLRNIYGINPDLLARSGPRLADGAEAVCEALDLARAVLP